MVNVKFQGSVKKGVNSEIAVSGWFIWSQTHFQTLPKEVLVYNLLIHTALEMSCDSGLDKFTMSSSLSLFSLIKQCDIAGCSS